MLFFNMDDSDIPIDIHTNKLLDWLISRRHVQKDWQTKVVKIREKINEAIKDMPEHDEITALLSGSYINYFHCLKLVEILKETEANSKNLFGQYSSKRMKDWLEIIKLYTRENIYLGEAASLLLRNVNYEVPALRKQISRIIQLTSEFDRKELEYDKLSELSQREFEGSCNELGIKGEKIAKELVEKAAEFPEINRKLSQQMKCLKPPLEFYKESLTILIENKDQILNLLQYIIEKGDTTVYEWKYGKTPTHIKPNPILVEEDEPVYSADMIDFGVDMNLDLDENIKWDISTEDSETATNDACDSVAAGDEALTILGNPETRSSVLNDVLELDAFLRARLYETNCDSECFSSAPPEVLQKHGCKTLEDMLSNVRSILENIKDPVSEHYLSVTTSPRYVRNLAEKLEIRRDTVEKMESSKEIVKQQRREVLTEGAALNPKLNLLIERTKELQDQIEEEISKKYNGRPVNLIGGANLL